MGLEDMVKQMQDKVNRHFFIGFEEDSKILLTDLVVTDLISREKVSNITLKLKNILFPDNAFQINGDIVSILLTKLMEQEYDIYILTVPNHMQDHYIIPLTDNFYEFSKYRRNYYDNGYLFYNSKTGKNVGIRVILNEGSKVRETELVDLIAREIGIFDRQKRINSLDRYAVFEKRPFIVNNEVEIRYVFEDSIYDPDSINDEEKESKVEAEVIEPINWLYFFQINYHSLDVLLHT